MFAFGFCIILFFCRIGHSLLLLGPINIYKTSEEVANALCSDVLAAAHSSIASRGKFTIAVPGGSVLKMLSKLKTNPSTKEIDWANVFLYYVNHKIVPDTDPTSTNLKAEGLFIKEIGLPLSNVARIDAPINGAAGHESNAHHYQKLIAKNVDFSSATRLPQ